MFNETVTHTFVRAVHFSWATPVCCHFVADFHPKIAESLKGIAAQEHLGEVEFGCHVVDRFLIDHLGQIHLPLEEALDGAM